MQLVPTLQPIARARARLRGVLSLRNTRAVQGQHIIRASLHSVGSIC